MTDDNIANEVQVLELDNRQALILLYDFEWEPATTFQAATILRFHSQETQEEIQFNGNIYYGMPILLEGVEKHADGAAARPNLTFPNVETFYRENNPLRSQLTAAGITDFTLEDLINKRIIQRKTLRKYIKLGAETAPTNSFEFPKNEYITDRISQKTSLTVVMELASPFELQNVKLPNRIVTGKYCPWSYKGWKLDKTDVKSACSWDSTRRDFNGNNPFVFFTVDDEPLVFNECIAPTGTELNWDIGTEYSASKIVSYQGNIFQSLTDGNIGNTPQEKTAHWRLMRQYSLWSTTLVATANATDPRASTYAFKNGNVFKCIRSHGSASDSTQAKDPEINQAFWAQADVCGKLLQSCKIRYQMKVATAHTTQSGIVHIKTDTNGARHMIPKATFNNEISLPFGGFPGTKQFR